MEKDELFNKCCWNNWIATCKKKKIEDLTFFTKTNSKWIRDLKHEKHKTVKLPDDNIGENADGLGYRNDLDITPQVYSKKELISWASLTLLLFCQRYCQEPEKVISRLRENIYK